MKTFGDELVMNFTKEIIYIISHGWVCGGVLSLTWYMYVPAFWNAAQKYKITCKIKTVWRI